MTQELPDLAIVSHSFDDLHYGDHTFSSNLFSVKQRMLVYRNDNAVTSNQWDVPSHLRATQIPEYYSPSSCFQRVCFITEDGVGMLPHVSSSNSVSHPHGQQN